uniref:SprT-like domain-containing protein n=1 Tax=Globisporangium ultimum (strain ATCC 200006 / CBS 805.95 / DAOM BR144) TaxID=431595 RepID=K3X821_GLOUD
MATKVAATARLRYEQKYDLLSPEYEVLDPNPDLHTLFAEYNTLFFYGKLAGCEVKWSNRMTLCFQPRSGFCSIRLSEPLLKLRPRGDMINTLLHEMIHAYVFVFSPVKDHDDHGAVFQSHMHRINQVAGTKITVFHTFHDEVDSYRQHWWKCDGPCQRAPPYYGVVKRAMNRPPAPTDNWWEDHQRKLTVNLKRNNLMSERPNQEL